MLSYGFTAPAMFAGLIIFMLIGFPVAFSLAALGLFFGLIAIELGYFTLSFLQALPYRVFGIMSNDLLLAIPFFTLMGAILERSGLAEDLLDGFVAAGASKIFVGYATDHFPAFWCRSSGLGVPLRLQAFLGAELRRVLTQVKRALADIQQRRFVDALGGHGRQIGVDARDRHELGLRDGRAGHAAERQKPPRAGLWAALVA